jgi:hypothetical protein
MVYAEWSKILFTVTLNILDFCYYLLNLQKLFEMRSPMFSKQLTML